VTFSYTQIAQYLRCPRSYRHRYLDGWREKDTRASLLFGRCFEKSLAAFFSGEDCTAALFKEWAVYQDTQIHAVDLDTSDARATATATPFLLNGSVYMRVQIAIANAVSTSPEFAFARRLYPRHGSRPP
jgi:hypothetical protein